MYNLAIIGGGPAGYTAASKALKCGLNVVMFEKQAIGGVCLNEGCIPTKTLLYSAKQFFNAKNTDKYGVYAQNVEYNWSRIQQRKSKVIRKLQAGIRAKLNSENCKYVASEAVVKNYSDTCVIIEADGQTYESEKLLVCTGSVNFFPPISGIESEHVLNSTSALNLQELPQSIIIVGGGVIGMEFATLYHELGIEVTVVEALPRILANVDNDIVDYLSAKYKKNGVRFLTDTRVQSIEDNKVICSHDNEFLTLEADKILVCIGRRPNLCGIESLNLELEGRGIKIDEYGRTSLPNVYAAGDVTGKLMLAHVASKQAEVAVGHIVGNVESTIDYNAVPSVVYTNPEIASIGMRQSDKSDLSVKQVPMTFSGRFVAENEAENGLCKVVYQPDGTIVGAHLIGNVSSEIISLFSMSISQRLRINDIDTIIFPHPTVSEIFKEALF